MATTNLTGFTCTIITTRDQRDGETLFDAFDERPATLLSDGTLLEAEGSIATLPEFGAAIQVDDDYFPQRFFINSWDFRCVCYLSDEAIAAMRAGMALGLPIMLTNFGEALGSNAEANIPYPAAFLAAEARMR